MTSDEIAALVPLQKYVKLLAKSIYDILYVVSVLDSAIRNDVHVIFVFVSVLFENFNPDVFGPH